MPIKAHYECMAILKPALTKEESDKIIDRFCEILKSQGAEPGKVDRLGRRKLSFPMKKQPEGFYVTLTFEGPGQAVAELERNLRIHEDVLKFQTLRIDPEKIAAARKRETAAPAPAAA